MPNMKSRIIAHNRKVMEELTEKPKMCNCRGKICPVEKKCLQTNVVYKATVTTKDGVNKHYIGSTGLSFKDRYTKHKFSFNHKKQENVTVLANYIWKLKNNKTDYTLKWEILARSRNKFNLKDGCQLCNLEKIEIAKLDFNSALNRRDELQSGCVHYRNMFL